MLREIVRRKVVMPAVNPAARTTRWFLTVVVMVGTCACSGRVLLDKPQGSADAGADASSGCVGESCPGEGCALVDYSGTGRNPWALSLDADYVYFVGDSGCGVPGPPTGFVARVSKCGNEEAQILADKLVCVHDVAVSATDLYFTSDTGVAKVPIDGGETTLIAGARATAVAVDTTHVYWSAEGDVLKAPLGGGSTEVVVNVDARDIGLDSTHAYLTDLMGVRRLPKAGGLVTLLATSPSPRGLAIDDTHVYWTDFGTVGGGDVDAKLMRVPKNEGAAETLAVVKYTGDDVALAGAYVYWPGDDSILRIPKAGGSAEAIATDYWTATFVAADSDAVYWTLQVRVMKRSQW